MPIVMKRTNKAGLLAAAGRSSRWWSPGCKAAFLGLALMSGQAMADSILVTDPLDMADSSGDIRAIQLTVENANLYLRMKVEGIAMPSVEETPVGMNNRYYYHFLLDTDNNVATGWDNAAYENTPTGVVNPVGADHCAFGLPGRFLGRLGCGLG
jgi:hypothetical protein